LHEVTLDLPPSFNSDNLHLVLETDAMGNNSKDWTFWSTPRFE